MSCAMSLCKMRAMLQPEVTALESFLQLAIFRERTLSDERPSFIPFKMIGSIEASSDQFRVVS